MMAGSGGRARGQEGCRNNYLMDTFSDRNTQYPDCNDVNLLVVIPPYNFAKHSCWGKLGKGHLGFLPYFLQLPVNLPLSKNKLSFFKMLMYLKDSEQ